MLAILALGGHYVIGGRMSLGDFAAFMSYVTLLIFPILVIGFMSNIIAQASASYERVDAVLSHPEPTVTGEIASAIAGRIDLADVSVTYGEKQALKNITFSLPPGTKTAIIGPTAAGKTQLLYLLTGLIPPQTGTVTYDGIALDAYDPETLHKQVGFVFQDSIIFNMSVRENIAFGDTVTDESLAKAIRTAGLDDFIGNLPEGLDTIVSERGASLSGGQKQRIMLARALALNPSVLLLDDFTARVDSKTEQRILSNIAAEFPDCTLVSVTQKIASVEHYDKIMVLMEGELLAEGTHESLMEHSPEYVQIYNSQRSTNQYELQS
jgi:ATP-binding cassette subfamily B protein